MTLLEELADLLQREARLEASLNVNRMYQMADADVLLILRSFRQVRQKRVKVERRCDVESKTDPNWEIADWERDVMEGRPYRTEDLPEFINND